jgi:hypothetical protein
VSNPFRRSVLSSAITIILLGGCSSATPTPSLLSSPAPSVGVSAPPSSTAAASLSPTPSAPPSTPPATPTAIPAGWHKVWPGSADPKALLQTVIATTRGFVAAGSGANGQSPAAVSSTDGVTWHSERITGGNRAPTELSTWGDRVLAAGPGGVACAHPYGLDTWVRSAAGAWSEAPFTNLFCGAEDVRIAFVGDVAILVGVGPGDNPVVWSSTDGLHWVDHGQEFSGLLPAAVTTSGGRTTLIAEGPTATWSSTTTDGSSWTAPAPIAGLPGGLTIHGAFLIDGAPTIVATVGGVLGTLRPDGAGGWTRTAATGLTADELGSISIFDGGLLAVGGNGPGAQAWVSRDGVAWRELDLPADLAANGAHVAGVAVRDGRAILVGGWPVGIDNATSTIWTGPANLLAP